MLPHVGTDTTAGIESVPVGAHLNRHRAGDRLMAAGSRLPHGWRASGIPDEGAVLRAAYCAFNLLIGFGGFYRSARDVPRHCRLRPAHAAGRMGWPPEAATLWARSHRRCSARRRLLAIRRQGIYFAMVTLALAQMIFFFYLQAPFTHGEDGIQSVPRGKLFGVLDLSGTLVMYYVVLAIFVAAFIFIYRVVHSPFGQVLKAIRENEPRAVSLGYDAESTSCSPSCVGRAVRPCGIDEAIVPARIVDRRTGRCPAKSCR
jgi:hypothetical protein